MIKLLKRLFAPKPKPMFSDGVFDHMREHFAELEMQKKDNEIKKLKRQLAGYKATETKRNNLK